MCAYECDRIPIHIMKDEQAPHRRMVISYIYINWYLSSYGRCCLDNRQWWMMMIDDDGGWWWWCWMRGMSCCCLHANYMWYGRIVSSLAGWHHFTLMQHPNTFWYVSKAPSWCSRSLILIIKHHQNASSAIYQTSLFTSAMFCCLFDKIIHSNARQVTTPHSIYSNASINLPSLYIK